MTAYSITAPKSLTGSIKLPTSKSISNRLLILSALSGSNSLPDGLSDSDDTSVLIDALRGLDIPARQHPLIHGDALTYSIGAASILAKVARDRYMIEQDALYPQYGFARNKGYGTAEHIAALKEMGPCPAHRRSFIRNFVE